VGLSYVLYMWDCHLISLSSPVLLFVPFPLWQLDYSNPQKGKNRTVIPTPAGIHPQIPSDPTPERV
ncbi:hypothetical protein AVEN_249892-1, partial [Araneus ventricosus]